jgi:hypothetical protein
LGVGGWGVGGGGGLAVRHVCSSLCLLPTHLPLSLAPIQETLVSNQTLPSLKVLKSSATCGLSSSSVMNPARALICWDAADPITHHGIYQTGASWRRAGDGAGLIVRLPDQEALASLRRQPVFWCSAPEFGRAHTQSSTGAVVMALQGGVEMELIVAQVRIGLDWIVGADSLTPRPSTGGIGLDCDPPPLQIPQASTLYPLSQLETHRAAAHSPAPSSLLRKLTALLTGYWRFGRRAQVLRKTGAM